MFRAIPKRETLLAAKLAREQYAYDPETGLFTRIRSIQGFHAGGIAGSVHNSGYMCLGIGRKVYLSHRVAWLFITGKWPEGQIDHINGKRADNRASNLRIATNQQNQANRKTVAVCGYKGVGWYEDVKRWRARIFVSGKTYWLGCFSTAEDAALAYNIAAVKYFGEYAKLNEV